MSELPQCMVHRSVCAVWGRGSLLLKAPCSFCPRTGNSTFTGKLTSDERFFVKSHATLPNFG